jgi:hypothetical protein
VTALGEAGVAMSSDSGSTPLASTKIHKQHAGVAQLVEHFTRNEGVAGSSPVSSTKRNPWDSKGFFVCKKVDLGHLKPIF